MTIAAGSEYGFVTEEEVVEERELVIDDLPALRLSTEYVNGPRIYYILGVTGRLPSDSDTVPYVMMFTNYGDVTFERDREAIDEIAGGFSLSR